MKMSTVLAGKNLAAAFLVLHGNHRHRAGLRPSEAAT